MNYYIADTHFGHNNILRLSNRPFSTIEEMDRTIIVNWIQYLRKLKGQKHLIIGNHDARMLKDPACKEYFVEIVDMKMVDDNGTQIFCCHYPLLVFTENKPGTTSLTIITDNEKKMKKRLQLHLHWTKKEKIINVSIKC